MARFTCVCFAALSFVLMCAGSAAGQNSSTTAPFINLASCANFAVMAGTAVAANGVLTTVTTGSVGVAPGTSITGNLALDSGTQEDDSSAAISCASDNLVAYAAAAAAPCGANISASDLAGMTIYPGVYCTASGKFVISASTVTLDGQGNANAVWIFKMATTIVTATATSFILQNGAQPGNVFWQVGSSATLGASSSFTGTILAYGSISMGSSSTLTGRALAQAGITFAGGDTVTLPTTTTVATTTTSTTAPPTTTGTATTSTALPTTTKAPTSSSNSAVRVQPQSITALVALFVVAIAAL